MRDDITHSILYAVFLGCFPIVGLFGICANIINIIIFIKNGFKESINVSLLGLAISDLLGLLIIVPMVVFFNPGFLQSQTLSWNVWDVFYFALAFPLALFFRITCFITVFITIERCLCFLIPLKVRILITPRRSTIFVVTIYIFTFATMVPAYVAVKLDKITYPFSNRTVLHMVYALEYETGVRMLMMTFSFNCAFQVLALTLLVIANIALTFSIKKQVKWREASIAAVPQDKGNDSDKDNAKGKKLSVVSQRSRRLGRMIQILSTILISSYLPSTGLFIGSLSDNRFFIRKQFHNEFFAFWSVAILIQATNSSINIFFYYRMNSRYKTAFNNLMGREDPKALKPAKET